MLGENKKERRLVSKKNSFLSSYFINITQSFVRIEETWRLWQKFLDDFSRFEEWLATSEKTAALPNSSDVLYTVAKEELKKFEVQIFHNLLLANRLPLTPEKNNAEGWCCLQLTYV